MTRSEVVAMLAASGRVIAANTWSAYVSRRQAPAPRRHVGRTPLWAERDVRAWMEGRRA